MNAQKAHLRHGDGLPGEDNPAIGIVFDEACTPIVGPAILAHAFIEMGVIDRVYDPVTDFTIALLEDTNSDGVASAGDMVRMGNYPLIFNPTINDLGTFQVESHVVLSADTILAKIGVDVTGARMEWSNNGSNLESFTDRDSLSPNFFRIS